MMRLLPGRIGSPAALTLALLVAAGGLPAAGQHPAAAGAGVSQAYRLLATWDGRYQQGGPGSLLEPQGSALAGDQLFVVDQGNFRVERFNTQLAFQGAWGAHGRGDGEFLAPVDVAVDGAKVYVTDREAGRVGIFSTDGRWQGSLTAPGLVAPEGIAAAAGRVAVSQPARAEVLVFGGGAVTARLGGFGEPRGLALAPDGRLFVADAVSSTVRIFAADLSPAGAITLPADQKPLDVAVDETGDAYVLTSGAILWYPSGAATSRVAMYYVGLRSVVVSSRYGIFGIAANDSRLFHGVVLYRWRPNVGQPTREWSLLSYPPGRFNRPHGIVFSDGRLWVLDAWPRLQALDPDGRPARAVNLPLAPVDVAVGTRGDLLVGESRRLVRLFPPFDTITTTVRLARGTTDFWLTAMHLDARSEELDFLDSATANVRTYGITNTVSALNNGWPLDGAAPWQLYWDLVEPAPNPEGLAYVVNRHGRRIETYQDQQLKATWPWTDIPTRIAWAPDGHLFVLSADGLVTKVDEDGNTIAEWDAGAFSADASEVSDLAADAGGRVYTTDRLANVVRVWERDPAATPEPVSGGRGGCRLRGDKTAAPASLRLGGAVTVTLDVGGECPSAAPQNEILLAIDRSFSMASNNQITDTKAAALAFVDRIDFAADRVGVLAFNHTAQLVQPLTSDPAAAKAAIGGLVPLGGTNIALALSVASGELFGPHRRPAARPVLVLLTDGRDDDSDRVLKMAADLKNRGARVFSIGFGDVDPRVMVMSASSPEDFFYAPTGAQLAAVYTEIARRLSATSLAQTMRITDTLPADMRLIPGSVQPAATVDATRRQIVWQLARVPFAGLRLSYLVEPQQLGQHPTNVEAEADYMDGIGQAGHLRFPVPVVDVRRDVPSPTPTWTPLPTSTPRPTAPPTDMPPEPIFLPLALAQSCEDRPVHVDIALVMDTSGSMNEPASPDGPTKLQVAVQAARAFVGQLQLPLDRAAVVSFNDGVELTQELSGDRELLLAKLDSLRTKTGTRIDLGLQAALDELTGPRSSPNNRVIVLLTDGRATGVDDAGVLAVAQNAKTAGLIIYAIGLGGDLDSELLRQVSSAPTHFFAAPTAADLAGIYEQIAYTLKCVNLDWPSRSGSSP